MKITGIKAVVLDVDGVLTDGTFVWAPNGEEFKRFSFRDVMGISLGKKAGIRFALISGESTPQVSLFAKKMGIEDVYEGCKDKAAALKEFAARRACELNEICFMGDDINDISAMKLVSLSAAPCDAHSDVIRIAAFVSKRPGGNGAVRELVDLLIAQEIPKP